MFLAEDPGKEQAIAERVDAAGDSTAHLMDEIKSCRVETRIAFPADVSEPMLDVRLSFRTVHRTEVVRSDDPLPKLLHLRPLHHRAQFRLADEEALQKRLLSELEVGK